MSPYQAVSARDAVGLMTAWAACPDGPPELLLDYLGQHLDESPHEFKLAAAVELVMGMTNLCGALLVLREHELGVLPQGTLSELALHYVEERRE